ncbi:Calmodulin-binding protein 60 C [Sesamum alatum]|uniref:Calmodulin-binding protein 60 C n=1 Tax=Sesamum alatum TaxID=300844 RepID=A0AAE1Y755_9LAMI|nr:Calmodulin-binding protein 60 C [Sesamum alatum]
MVLKRQLREGGEAGSELPSKRRHLVSTIFKGLNYGRTLQEYVPCLEPIIRKWVQEAVERAIDTSLRSSYNQVECSGSRSLQLQFHSNLAHTLFTGSRIVSEDRTPIKISLYDSSSQQIITSGPLSSVKVKIVVLDGDFGPDHEEWTQKEFNRRIVKNREGKRPLVAGELIVPLQDGVGYIGEISFTDNSSWIRSGKFRLGAQVHASSDELRIREAISSSFKVKDHRGESYQKHYPPSLDDEVWRLEKIAKDGTSHQKLTQYRINSVRDFLRLYFTDQFTLRAILDKVSKRTWETIIGHATTCTLDDEKYMYRTAQGTGLLFNSIYKVIGVTFDGQSSQPVNTLNIHQMRMVENLKQHAYRNIKDWVSICDPSIGYPMLSASPAAVSLMNPNMGLHGVNFQEQDHHETETKTYCPTLSPPYQNEVEQHNCSFELGESSYPMQGFNPTFRNSFGTSDSPPGFYIGGDYIGHQLSTDDLPIDDFQVDSSALQGNGLFLDPNNPAIVPRNPRPKTRWCKVLAVVKWRILVRRNVAARKWKRFYNYM